MLTGSQVCSLVLWMWSLPRAPTTKAPRMRHRLSYLMIFPLFALRSCARSFTPHCAWPKQAGWDADPIYPIEEDHRELRHAVSSESQFKASLWGSSEISSSFPKGWALWRKRFDKLQLFVVVLASTFLNPAIVKSNVLVIGAGKHVYGQSLTDFSFEEALHAKQFKSIQSLSTE